MKNSKILIVFIVVIFFCYNSGFSQYSKGQILIGAGTNASFTSSSYSTKSGSTTQKISTTSTFSISPELGVFVIDRLAIGLSLPLSFSTEIDEQYKITYNYSTVVFAPFARYYLGNGNTRPYLTGSLGTGVQSALGEDNYGNTQDYKAGIFYTKIGGGLDIFLIKNVSFDLGLYYSSMVKNPKGDSSSDPKQITKGINIEFGFLLHF